MKYIYELLILAGMKEVSAKILLYSVGLIFFIAPTMFAGYNFVLKLYQFSDGIDTIIDIQKQQSRKLDSLQYQIYDLQLQSAIQTGYVFDLSEAIERSGNNQLILLKEYNKKPVNMPLIIRIEEETKTFMEETLPHKKETPKERKYSIGVKPVVK